MRENKRTKVRYIFTLYQKRQFISPNKGNLPSIRNFPSFSIFGHVTMINIHSKKTSGSTFGEELILFLESWWEILSSFLYLTFKHYNNCASKTTLFQQTGFLKILLYSTWKLTPIINFINYLYLILFYISLRVTHSKAHVLLHCLTGRNIIWSSCPVLLKLYGLKCILAVTEVIIRVSGKIALAVYLPCTPV